MIKIKIFQVESNLARDVNHEDKELGPMEEFIAQIGYEKIKNILLQSTSDCTSFYAIFYEDNLPYTPRSTPKKKGFFG